MELKDTIELMTSLNYKYRFIAEYLQVKIRYNKLQEVINKRLNNELDFDTPIPLDSWLRQSSFMYSYMTELEYQASIHGIDLTCYNKNT